MTQVFCHKLIEHLASSRTSIRWHTPKPNSSINLPQMGPVRAAAALLGEEKASGGPGTQRVPMHTDPKPQNKFILAASLLSLGQPNVCSCPPPTLSPACLRTLAIHPNRPFLPLKPTAFTCFGQIKRVPPGPTPPLLFPLHSISPTSHWSHSSPLLDQFIRTPCIYARRYACFLCLVFVLYRTSITHVMTRH